MTEQKHTPGPLLANGCTLQTETKFIGLVGAPSDRGQEELENARLLAASYNAFDSAAARLGLNAVEFAERMQGGEVADLVEALREIAKGEGPFSRDLLTHAENTIRAMKELAERAVARIEGRP